MKYFFSPSTHLTDTLTMTSQINSHKQQQEILAAQDKQFKREQQQEKNIAIILWVQSGKTAEIRKQAMSIQESELQQGRKAPVIIWFTQNDKNLAGQSGSALDDAGLKTHFLSSSSKTTVNDVIIDVHDYIDEYNKDDMRPRAVCALANAHQVSKCLELIHRIGRWGEKVILVFDEADLIYDTCKKTTYTDVNGKIWTIPKMMDEQEDVLLRVIWCTATCDKLQDVVEFQSSKMYTPSEDSLLMENDPSYRGFTHVEADIKPYSTTTKQKNNKLVLDIIEMNKDHFLKPFQTNNGITMYPKTIVTSDRMKKNMSNIANTLVELGFVCIIFNGDGLTLVRKERQNSTYKMNVSERLSEILYYIFETQNLWECPVIVIGKMKIDRGLSFSHIPRETKQYKYEGGRKTKKNASEHKEITISPQGKHLIFTDIILGSFDDMDNATQCAGRIQGKIAHSPYYVPSRFTFWVEQYTAELIKRQIQTVKYKNESQYQGMEHEDVLDEVDARINQEFGIKIHTYEESVDRYIADNFAYPGNDTYNENFELGTNHIICSDKAVLDHFIINILHKKPWQPSPANIDSDGFINMALKLKGRRILKRSDLQHLGKATSTIPNVKQALNKFRNGDSTFRVYVFYDDVNPDANYPMYALLYLRKITDAESHDKKCANIPTKNNTQ
jgi:hypothetical protein